MGDSITEGTISQWVVNEGDSVNADDVVCVIETDKVSIDVRAPCSGKITKHLAEADAVVGVGAPLFEIEEGEGAPAKKPEPKAEEPAKTKETKKPEVNDSKDASEPKKKSPEKKPIKATSDNAKAGWVFPLQYLEAILPEIDLFLIYLKFAAVFECPIEV